MLRWVFNKTLYLRKCVVRWINAEIFRETTKQLPALQAVIAMSSSNAQMPKVVAFQQVKALHNDTLLIDVRQPSELQQFGVLPNSINIPLGNVELLRLLKIFRSEEFKKLCGCKKPDLSCGAFNPNATDCQPGCVDRANFT